MAVINFIGLDRGFGGGCLLPLTEKPPPITEHAMTYRPIIYLLNIRYLENYYENFETSRRVTRHKSNGL